MLKEATNLQFAKKKKDIFFPKLYFSLIRELQCWLLQHPRSI